MHCPHQLLEAMNMHNFLKYGQFLFEDLWRDKEKNTKHLVWKKETFTFSDVNESVILALWLFYSMSELTCLHSY